MPERTLDKRPLYLIVENEFVIGMDIEARLNDLGYDDGALLPTCAAGLSWLSANTPQVAVLDYLLRDGPCTELVRELNRRGIPMLVYSGLQRDAQAGPDYDNVPWVEKPGSIEAALKALTTLAQSRQDNVSLRAAV